ncbi:MAG: hypothetical protein LBB75_06615 [Oscillospiraceae bacterium]|jgi:hypothetical protein|nr:hypothetical protein [Oscillospiraceae bacterium]
MAGSDGNKTYVSRRSEARLREDVIDGYRRLAFGSNRDTLRLMFRDDTPSPAALSRMDIFNVSAIKRDRGGAVEIKFYDRCDALEHLEAFCTATEGREGVKAFYDAIARSVED